MTWPHPDPAVPPCPSASPKAPGSGIVNFVIGGGVGQESKVMVRQTATMSYYVDHVILTAPKFTRQIQGRPKTDRRDCQWIQRLHQHGLLPKVFQPDDATQTLRDYVRQRASLVRLSSHHIQRMQKALELMK